METQTRVLITGAGGQLATDLEKKLLERSSLKVFAMDEKELDILDRKLLEDTIGNNIDVVVNCAAWTDVDGAEKKENHLKVYNINAKGARNVAEICQEHNVKLIHISTDYVFSGDYLVRRPLTPESPEDPQSMYGESKFWGERYISDEMPSAIIIRTSWLHGQNGKNFVKAIATKFLDGKELEVINDQYGAPTSTVHLSGLIDQMIVRSSDYSLIFGIWHYSNQGITNWHKVAKYIVEKLGGDPMDVKAITTDDINQVAKRPKWSVLDCGKTIKVFGNIPSWEDGVDETLKMYKK